MVEGKITSQANRNPLLKHLALGVILLNIVVAAIILLSLHNSRAQYEEQAAINIRNIALVLDQNISHIFQEVDLALQAVVDEAERQLTAGVIDKGALDYFVVREHSRLPELAAFRATDASGEAVYGAEAKPVTTASLAHRDYFSRLRAEPNAGLVISKPLAGGISGEWMLVLAKRYNDRDGAFAGLVYAGLGLDRLSRSFRELNIGASGSITLLDRDQSLVVRHPTPASVRVEIGRKVVLPEMPELIGRGETSATFTASCPVDGVERRFAFRTLSHNQPFYIIAGAASGDYLAGWRSEAFQMSLLWAAFSIGSLLFAWLFHRSWNKAAKAEQEALKSEQRFRAFVENAYDFIYTVSPAGIFTYVAPNVEALLGYLPSELIGTSCESLIHPEDFPSCKAFLRRTVELGTVQSGHEYRIRRKNGGWLWLLSNGSLVTDAVTGDSVFLGIGCDITDRKQAEESLQALNEDLERRVLDRTRSAEEANKVLRTIIECMSDWVWDVDAEGRYAYCSPQVEALLGYRPDEMIGKTPCDFMSDEAAQCARFVLGDLLRSGERIRSLESWFIAKDGRKVLLSTSAAPIFDEAGSLTGYRGVDADLTERRRAEAALRESEENFRTFFESMADMIFVVSPEGRLIFANHAVERTLGYSSEELAVTPLLHLHPESKRGEAGEIFAAMLRGEREACPLPLVAKNGAAIPVETRVWMGRWNGEDCVFGISKNLTAEVEAQQRFERLFDNNPAPMAVSTVPDKKFTQVNDAFLKALGYSRAEVIGKTSSEIGLFPNSSLQADTAERLRTDGRIAEVELKVRRKDGAVLDGLFSGELISSQGREYYLTVMIDLTERKQAEIQRLQWEQRLQQARKAESLGRMAGAVAHNFNNMLGAVIGNLELAQGDLVQGSEVQICVSEALDASQRAAKISRLMLTYLGQITRKAEVLDAAAAVRKACSLLSASLPENVRLRADLSSSGPVIRGDSAHLTQILTNLITNSVEAIGDQGGEIAVSVEVVPEEALYGLKLFPPDWEATASEYVRLSVADTGPGIAVENLDKVFDPFFSTRFTGRGLGLSVALGLLQGFEGAISVENNPDRGVTFNVLLPVSEQAH